jgi:hypothetical protein
MSQCTSSTTVIKREKNTKKKKTELANTPENLEGYRIIKIFKISIF